MLESSGRIARIWIKSRKDIVARRRQFVCKERRVELTRRRTANSAQLKASSRRPAFSPAGRGISRGLSVVPVCANVHRSQTFWHELGRAWGMRPPKQFFVYIMTNRNRSHVLYTGVTGGLVRRVWQHKNGVGAEFTSRYNLTRLVYYERFGIPTRLLRGRRRSRGGGGVRRFA
jgi:putative endonuclease